MIASSAEKEDLRERGYFHRDLSVYCSMLTIAAATPSGPGTTDAWMFIMDGQQPLDGHVVINMAAKETGTMNMNRGEVCVGEYSVCLIGREDRKH